MKCFKKNLINQFLQRHFESDGGVKQMFSEVNLYFCDLT